MTNKERYAEFCKTTYIPIFSKPWWMDAVCGQENWDVWLYSTDDQIQSIEAAMPYYMERRGDYRYITKAPLTQNNGILFRKYNARKAVTVSELQGKVIRAACAFIKTLDLDVYEQQFHHSFQNWSPFFWNNYTCITRYTYVIEDTSDLARVMDRFTASYRNEIRKGQRSTVVTDSISPEVFYSEHEKIYSKQNLPVPFSRKLWLRLYETCRMHDAGQMICARDEKGNVHSLMFVVWDEAALYLLMGGCMPEFSYSQAYPALIWHSIGMAHERGLAYDFEGSMIERVARSFRQFGGVPKPYYRIRKIFNPEIVRKEAEDYIRRIQSEI